MYWQTRVDSVGVSVTVAPRRLCLLSLAPPYPPQRLFVAPIIALTCYELVWTKRELRDIRSGRRSAADSVSATRHIDKKTVIMSDSYLVCVPLIQTCPLLLQFGTRTYSLTIPRDDITLFCDVWAQCCWIALHLPGRRGRQKAKAVKGRVEKGG